MKHGSLSEYPVLSSVGGCFRGLQKLCKPKTTGTKPMGLKTLKSTEQDVNKC